MSSSEEFNLIDLEDNLSDTIVNNDIISSNSSDGITSDPKVHGLGITSNKLDLNDINSVSDNVVVANKEPKWAELPSYVVEKIYSFLRRTDQSHMSQVCSRWANDFESPSLWKRMTFILDSRNGFLEFYPEVKFARKYGYMFRHVKIIGTIINSYLIGVMWVQLKLFLQAMTSSSQLTSITFINMGVCFINFRDILLDFYQIVTSFFNSQDNLQSVTFQDSYFCKKEASELLKAIFHSDVSNIKILKFRVMDSHSYSTTCNVYYLGNLMEVCDRILKVRSLEFDYTEIFEDLIKCLHQKISQGEYHPDKQYPSLSTLTIFCENHGLSVFEGIPSNIWKGLSNAFPGLKVKMFVPVYSHIFSHLNEFLVKHIPLESLDIRFERLSRTLQDDIKYLFIHLQFCLYQDHLKVFNILWIPSNADFEGTVIPYIKSCQKLRDLFFFVDYPPVRIENILDALFLNRPKSLKFIRISFSNYEQEEDESNLRALSEQYFQLFNSKGIKCFLDVHPTIRRLQPLERLETVLNLALIYSQITS